MKKKRQPKPTPSGMAAEIHKAVILSVAGKMKVLTDRIERLENEIIEKGTFWGVLHTDILLLKNKIKK